MKFHIQNSQVHCMHIQWTCNMCPSRAVTSRVDHGGIRTVWPRLWRIKPRNFTLKLGPLGIKAPYRVTTANIWPTISFTKRNILQWVGQERKPVTQRTAPLNTPPHPGNKLLDNLGRLLRSCRSMWRPVDSIVKKRHISLIFVNSGTNDSYIKLY